jgi:hypothetical protein
MSVSDFNTQLLSGLLTQLLTPQFLTIAVALFVIGLFKFKIKALAKTIKRSSASGKGQDRAKYASGYDLSKPENQMQYIAKIDFKRKRLLNAEEAKILPALERLVAASLPGYRVMAQTSLGELIQPETGKGARADQENARRSINSKRLDFAIIDRSGYLACAVEYNGTGHHQKAAFMRDAVKREAVRKSGAPYVEIEANTPLDEITRLVRQALGINAMAA